MVELGQRVASRDRLLQQRAAATEGDPAEDRHVVIGSDLGAAVGAVRAAGGDHGFRPRHAIGHDGDEAADERRRRAGEEDEGARYVQGLTMVDCSS